jgi:Contractile injection system tube protein
MQKLDKAYLQELSPAAAPQPVGKKVPVQFNPTTLKLSMNNSIDVAHQRGRQVQQYKGTSSTTLTMDLVYDTADEGSDEHPVDVRRKTQEVGKFLLPSGPQSKTSPPRVRFQWGTFIFDGVMASLNEDLEHFAPNGTPLRAKCAISIKEQDPKFEALKTGAGAAGANTGEGEGGASNPAAPGSTDKGPTDRSAQAVGGESAADFAARNGLDPAAWRGVAAGIANPLSLPAGLDISFNSGLSASAGLGASLGVGIGAGVGLSVEASLGLQADVSLGVTAGASAGFALSAAGGVTAAVQTASIVRTESAAAQARSAFGAPAATSGATGTRGGGSLPGGGSSLAGGGAATAAQTGAAGGSAPARPAAAGSGSAAPARPVADPRAASFGYGVPLRPLVTGPADDRPGASTWIRVGSRPRAAEPKPVSDPTLPGWAGLRPVPAGQSVPGAHTMRAGCGCGCGGRP